MYLRFRLYRGRSSVNLRTANYFNLANSFQMMNNTRLKREKTGLASLPSSVSTDSWFLLKWWSNGGPRMNEWKNERKNSERRYFWFSLMMELNSITITWIEDEILWLNLNEKTLPLTSAQLYCSTPIRSNHVHQRFNYSVEVKSLRRRWHDD